jgi:hypothetical protein
VKIPKALLPQRDVWVRDHLGEGPNGDVFTDWRKVDRCKVEQQRRMVRGLDGQDSMAAGRITLNESDGPFSESTEFRLWTGRPNEQVVQAVAVEFFEHPPAPTHWVVYFS